MILSGNPRTDCSPQQGQDHQTIKKVGFHFFSPNAESLYKTTMFSIVVLILLDDQIDIFSDSILLTFLYNIAINHKLIFFHVKLVLFIKYFYAQY